MNKLIKYVLFFNGVIVILVMLGVFATYIMPAMDVQTPGLGMQEVEELKALSPINPVEVGDKLTDTITYTLDASIIEKWVFFDFSKGSVVTELTDIKDPKGWDMAFRRAKMVSNGGGTNKNGTAAVAKLQTKDFNSVTEVPANTKFLEDFKSPRKADSENMNLEQWYSYSFLDHYLRSHKNVFLIKTAEGNYAKMQIVNYYCKQEEKETNKKKEDKTTGCYTIKYVYQGNGTNKFVSAANAGEPAVPAVPVKQQMKKKTG